MHKVVAGTGIAVVAMILMTSALAVLQNSTAVTHNGAIQSLNVGIFQDSACTQPLSALNWGTLKPGTAANKTIYVKNTGNTAVTLNMTVTTWNPTTASSYITLTWDKQGSLLAAGNVAQTLLVLSVLANVNGFTEFNCTTLIAGNGPP
jgi:archaellum component FlaG (FlaF/FlaG flagellin family)